MAETYGVLCSVRHQAKKTNDLLNALTARWGTKIVWHPRTGFHEIVLADGSHILFRRRGNKYANYLELCSVDMNLLRFVKQVFPDDFKAEVIRKEGLLE